MEIFGWSSTVSAVCVSVGIYVAYAFLLTSRKRSFKGKVVVITGCSSGIGEELAFKYAKEGSKLVLAARRVEKLEQVVQKCIQLGGEAIAVATDVAVEADCKNLINEAVKRFKSVDLLILNAGQGCLMKVEDVKDDVTPFRRAMEVNFWGCVYPTIHALDYLRNSRGAIAVISSLASKIPTPRRTIYGASKAGVNQFFNALRVEEPNISVSIICPGFVLTEFHEHAFSPNNKAPKRHTQNFMTSERCAEIIKDTVAHGKREEVMTLKGKLGSYLGVFIPGLVDKMAAKYSESSVQKE